ncbi:MAG: haloacid dehalogenase type II [Bacteroidota bacterium]|nr:haloacid dehalogenase type II [Bacteroidota bacterium]
MQEPEAANHPPKPKVIILDVYETLLNMSDVERKVNTLLDSGKGYMLWFEMFQQYLFVENCLGQFSNFVTIAKATMQMTAQKMGRQVREDDIEFVLELLKHLPVHDQVQEGLSELNDLGYRIAALTNSPENVVYERMEPTGLISYFEYVLSADKIKKYKPCIEVYEWAVKKLGVEKEETMLVSAHGWDIAGAAKAGLQTAYLKQNRQMLYPLAPAPRLVCTSLTDLAAQLSSYAGRSQVNVL